MYKIFNNKLVPAGPSPKRKDENHIIINTFISFKMASFKEKKKDDDNVPLRPLSPTVSDSNNVAPPAYFNDAEALARLQISRTKRMQRAYTHANIATLVRWVLNLGLFTVTTLCVVGLNSNQTAGNVSKYGLVSVRKIQYIYIWGKPLD